MPNCVGRGRGRGRGSGRGSGRGRGRGRRRLAATLHLVGIFDMLNLACISHCNTLQLMQRNYFILFYCRIYVQVK